MTGFILICIGFALMYIVSNIVPFIYGMIFFFSADEMKERTIEEWLFEPILGMLILIPFIGSLFGAMLMGGKWTERILLISIYMIIVGIIIGLIEYV